MSNLDRRCIVGSCALGVATGCLLLVLLTRSNVRALEDRVAGLHERVKYLEADATPYKPVGLLSHGRSLGPMIVGAVPFGTSYQQIDNATLATSTTLPNVPAGANVAWVVPEGRALRWRNDGTAPTAANGMPIGDGSVLTYDLNEGPLQIIRQADGVVAHVWYGRGPI